MHFVVALALYFAFRQQSEVEPVFLVSIQPESKLVHVAASVSISIASNINELHSLNLLSAIQLCHLVPDSDPKANIIIVNVAGREKPQVFRTPLTVTHSGNKAQCHEGQN